MSNSRRLLLFPPLCAEATGTPYLSIYNLASILQRNQVETELLDLNEIFIQKMLNKDVLNEILVQVQKDDELSFSKKEYFLNVLKAGIESKDFSNIFLKRNVGDILLKYGCKTPDNFEVFFTDDYEFPKFVLNILSDLVIDHDLTQYTLIGISCAFSDQLYFSLALARILKKLNPEIKFIIGGPQVSLLGENQLKLLVEARVMDIIFTGYGENAIIEFFRSPNRYKGLYRDTSFGSISLKEYPHADFSSYLKLNPNPSKIPVLISKGCFWGKCEFCDFILMGDLDGLRFKTRPPEEVLDEIIEIRKVFPTLNIDLVSDAIPPAWYKKLVELALEKNVYLGTAGYMINNRLLTDEFFSKLKKAGGLGVVFGTESTVNRVLKLMGKMANKKDIFMNLKAAKKHGIYTQVNIIMDYPTVTYEEALITYRDINILSDCIDLLACFKFHLSTNTELFNNPEKTGIEIKNTPYLRYNTGGLHLKEFNCDSGMTDAQKEDIYRKFSILSDKIKNKQFVRELKQVLDENPNHLVTINNMIKISETNLTNIKSGISMKYPDEILNFLRELIQNPREFSIVKQICISKFSEHEFEKLFSHAVFDIYR